MQFIFLCQVKSELCLQLHFQYILDAAYKSGAEKNEIVLWLSIRDFIFYLSYEQEYLTFELVLDAGCDIFSKSCDKEDDGGEILTRQRFL